MTEEKETKSCKSMNWPLVLVFLHTFSLGLWGVVLIFSQAKILTTLFTLCLVSVGMLGTTAGCHRMWAHNTFKGTYYLRLFLMLANTLVLQCPIYDWVKDHRIHHKYHGTDKDPYNYKKGFWYCHFLSHCLQEDEEDPEKDKEIDMSDIEADEIVMFQKKYYWLLAISLGVILPMWIPVKFFGESIFNSVILAFFFRVSCLLQAAWFINSASIVWGLDPLDRKSGDTNLVFIVNKSLWPQYHYLLPWDYLSGEYGTYNDGCTTRIIQIFSVLGLVTELSTISSEGVREALAQAVNAEKPVLDCLLEKRTFSDVSKLLS